MSSDGGGIHQYNLATQSFEENPSLEKINALAGDAVISLIKDDFNNIWIGSYGNGLIRYNLSSRSLKRYTKEDSNLSSNFVWSLYVDQSGQLWIGTITYGGFASFNYNKDQIEKINIQTDNVLVIKELSDNKIALGCYNGIIIYEPDVKKSIFFSTNYAVRSIIETDEQKLLIGSETDGLKYVDLVKGDIIPVSNPLESLNENIITAIIADVNKNLWISTSNGLFRYMEHSKELDIYNTKDGIQGMEFNFSSVLQTLSGKLLFGGTNGFTFFDPLKIVPDTTRYPLLITDFSIHNQSVFSGPEQKSELLDMLKNKNIVLKYNQGNFSFDFIAISFNNPSIIKYAYMLEGIENSWNYTSSNRSAYYSRLAPGKYTFKIKYATQLNLWNNTPLEIKIRVLPPFYMTWWAYSAYFIIITLIILIIIRIQRRENKLKQDLTLADIKEEHTKELQTMREQFFINISHELRTPLTLIISPLKDFINSHPFNPPNLTELQNIYSNANRLLSLINRLLLFRKTEMGKNTLRVSMLDIVWFSRKIFDSFNHLAQKKDIDYSFSSTNESVNFLFDPEKMEIILYNLLSNAFKYTPEGGAIILQLEYKPDDQIRIKVSDSGCGIEENEFDKIIQRFYSSNKLAGIGIGLSLVKNYTELMGGTLHIESKVGIGSSFSMLFNLRAMYKDSEIEPEAKKLYTPSQTMIENIENIYLSTKEQIKSSSIDNNGKIAKILIVEDNKEISDYIKKCLSVTQKYEILEAEDGISALNIARSELPEIIISDIHMPNMNGLELCESIKNNIETNHIYFILITADVLESTENKGLSMGADEFITKPFDSIKLLNKVNTIQKYYQKTREHFETQIQSYSPATREHSINNDFINMCITNVRSKYNSENFNPITLAQMMNMSHSSLYKKIKLFTGQSVSEFIRTIRLTIAAELIQEGKLTISEIAFEVGISDSKYFRQCFKKQYGTLPSDYNKKNPPKQQT